MNLFKNLLKELGATEKLIVWCEDRTIEDIVETSDRGDMLFEIASIIQINEKTMFLVKGLCAKTVLYLMGNNNSKYAVSSAIAYGKGEITREKLKGIAQYAFKAISEPEMAYIGKFIPSQIPQFSKYLPNKIAAIAAYLASSNVKGNSNTAYTTAMAQSSGVNVAKNRMETAVICREKFGDELIIKVNERLRLSN